MRVEVLKLICKIGCKSRDNVLDLLAWSIPKREVNAFRNCGEVLSCHNVFSLGLCKWQRKSKQLKIKLFPLIYLNDFPIYEDAILLLLECEVFSHANRLCSTLYLFNEIPEGKNV
tara:strand:- start:1621 stop:1965 length:345 start_codon:yes stop_codon:yes gene_type:complete